MRWRVVILKDDEVILTSAMFKTREEADDVKVYLWKLFGYTTNSDLTFRTENYM